MKVLSIIGTRPEAVKMAPVVKALQSHPQIESVVCVTAQHREMLDQVLNLFAIQPTFDLNIMQSNQSLSLLTARIIEHLAPVLAEVQPDWVLAQGDTTTVMCAGLLSYYHRFRFGHVEAGLRTRDKWQPYPEEVNRRIAAVVSDLHFAPTEHSRKNLLNEGIEDWRILVTGNPVIDALNEISSSISDEETDRIFQQLGIDRQKRLILMTAHRRENFGAPLREIFSAIRSLAHQRQDCVFVYPVHLNPNVQEMAGAMLGEIPNVLLLDPLSYLPLVAVLKTAYLVLTDSGGIQEEATALNKPTLVLREVTERPEGLEAGVLKLVGHDSRLIISSVNELLTNPGVYAAMSSARNPFGDGDAAKRIVQGLIHFQDRSAV